MGVIIQEMVNPDVAGVLFTCDPISGNPLQSVINADFGIGEGVVSGNSTPFTYKISLNAQNRYTCRRYVVEPLGAVPHNGQMLCLTEKECIDLVEIGRQLAIYFDGSVSQGRDIEWALTKSDNKLCWSLLQCRPVTGLQLMTDYQRVHEFDTPIDGAFEVNSTHNVGEVMPGALSPLAHSTIAEILDKVLQLNRKCMEKGDWRIQMLSMVNLKRFAGKILHCTSAAAYNRPNAAVARHGTEMLIGGELYQDAALDEWLNGRDLLYTGFWNSIKFFSVMWGVLKTFYEFNREDNIYKQQLRLLCEKAEIMFNSLEAGAEKIDDPKKMYGTLGEMLPIYAQGIYCHVICTSYSALYQMMLAAVLWKDWNKQSLEFLHDLSLILADCTGVESADVPKALDELGELVANENPDIVKLTPEKAEIWLLYESPVHVRNKVKAFLARHGHRCAIEFDVMEYAWSEKPGLTLIPTLQNTISAKSEKYATDSSENMDSNKKPMSEDDIINQLQTLRAYKMSEMNPLKRTPQVVLYENFEAPCKEQPRWGRSSRKSEGDLVVLDSKNGTISLLNDGEIDEDQ